MTKRLLALAALAACGAKTPAVHSTGDDPGADEPTAVDPADPGSDPVASTGDAAADEMLAAHNRYRADHCAPPLVWSDEVAASAQAWADHLRDDGCAFEHSDTAYGENLGAGSTGTMPPQAVVDMWYREIDTYDFAHGGFSMDTGHFTQVVWRDTKRLGCGMSQCDGMDVWVCEYDPPGNYDGEFDAQVLPTSCR